MKSKRANNKCDRKNEIAKSEREARSDRKNEIAKSEREAKKRAAIR